MYLEGIGIRSIERLENVSAPLILKWIKGISKIIKNKLHTVAESINEENFKKENIEILEIDEITDIVKKKTKDFGYGLLLTENKSCAMGACSQSQACRQDEVCHSEAEETGIKLLIMKTRAECWKT